MNRGLYNAVQGMTVNERRLDAVAHNLANAGTSGFKKRTTAFDARIVHPDPRHRVLHNRHAVDFSQGELERTGRPFDLALQGQGFFAVETPVGEAFTRNGSFRLDAGGTLVTAEGFPVAWAPASGQIDPVGERVVVDSQGVVWQGANEVGRLRVTDFANHAGLSEDRYGYLHPMAGLAEVAHDAEVHQGALEGANVNPVEEMIALVEIQRAYEHSARALSAIERTYERLNRGQ